jgi:Putative 2OG-Fe(II) oxygenase
VVPIFATPFGVVAVPDAEARNPALAELFTARATPERADAANTQALAYRCRDDLFQWSDGPVRELCAGIVGAVVAFVRELNDFSDAQFAALRMQVRAWYTIVRPDGCIPSCNYSNAAWCAVYCVAAPPLAKERFDSGVLRLHESFRATMFSDATNTVTHAPYRPGHCTWRPVPGEVAIFPASTTHEIALLRAAENLVLVTALARFTAPGQTGLPWW